MVCRTLGTPEKAEIGKSKLEIEQNPPLGGALRRTALCARGIMPQSRGERYRETGIVGEAKKLRGDGASAIQQACHSPDFRHSELGVLARPGLVDRVM
jgi:hypothetical protein